MDKPAKPDTNGDAFREALWHLLDMMNEKIDANSKKADRILWLYVTTAVTAALGFALLWFKG